ncbi:MAG: tetratricopeptide repeat protein [Spirochaetes bacterium]|nr:tetratricopeptide repeat protein [Spirochaetota bacterium]
MIRAILLIITAAIGFCAVAAPPDPDFLEAEKAYFQNRFGIARRLMDAYLQKYPNTINDRAFFYLGNMCAAESNYAQAMKYYRVASELNGDEPAYIIDSANMHYEMRSFTNALINYRRGIALVESLGKTNFFYLTPYLHIGHTYMQLSDYTNAANWYETFLTKITTNYYQYERIRTVIDLIRSGKIPMPITATNTTAGGNAFGLDISVTNINPDAKKIESELPKKKYVPKDEDIVE